LVQRGSHQVVKSKVLQAYNYLEVQGKVLQMVQ
jgi:hypothetical protein